MIPSSIIKACAELDGCKPRIKKLYFPDGEWQDGWLWSNGEYHSKLPNYTNDYNEIIRLVQKQPKRIREAMAEYLWVVHGIDSDWSEQESWAQNFLTTPSQLCEALLRAHNKWSEE